MFVVVTLAVTNRLRTPQQFGGVAGGQAALLAGGRVYDDSLAAERQADRQSFMAQAREIGSGQTQMGDLVFDLPLATIARARTSGAGLIILDFGAAPSAKRVGILAIDPFS